MKKIMAALAGQIKQIFEEPHDQRMIDAINIHNIRNVRIFSVLVCVFDTASLVLFSAMNWSKPDFWLTFFKVVYCVVSCMITAGISKKMIRKYEKEGKVSNLRANALVIFFYVVLSAWGILVDVTHYQAGEQMLTFYIVQFCFVCFVAMRPRIGAILILMAYSALYICVYIADGAVSIQPQNYIIFAIIAVVGNAIQHMTLQESEKYKVDILKLNQIVRQEASIDDLTDLKNRTALRNDFETYVGKTVYAIMADVDGFKHYNDAYGHLVGDEVLRMVAMTTKKVFWDGDVYRYGGDEFLVVLSGSTDDAFAQRTQKWMEEIQSIQIPNVTQAIAVSYGYERRVLNDAQDLRSAIKTADIRLYNEKRTKYGEAAQ